MPLIPLTKDKSATVDQADLKELSKYRWQAKKFRRGWYAVRNEYQRGGGFKTVLMHRFLLNAPKSTMVDHKNGDPLDNRRKNLRACSPSQNAMNKRKRIGKCSSKYKGVYFAKWTGKWRASIGIDGRRIQLGLFKDERDAALAYNKAAKKYHGGFARFNEVPNA